LKKRSKKLLAILPCRYGNIRFLTPIEKSFLVLFFKKEQNLFLKKEATLL